LQGSKLQVVIVPDENIGQDLDELCIGRTKP
jgi:hypothetical protein